jgi:hypothetical protein
MTIDINAIKIAMDGLVAADALAESKLEALAAQYQARLLSSIALRTQEISAVAASLQAELDKIPPIPPAA